MLMLSGIQHYVFCPRQWALINIEQQWSENMLTTEGQIMHEHVDNPFYRQKVGSFICLRSVNVASKELGLYGISDMIELHPSYEEKDSIIHPEYPGRWIPYPIEYKHGKPKRNNADIVQLTAQAICLEEQYGINIYVGAIFYGETRRREEVEFTNELRSETKMCSAAMHKMINQGIVPSAEYRPCCRSCSLKDVCMPEILTQKRASEYLRQNLYEEIT